MAQDSVGDPSRDSKVIWMIDKSIQNILVESSSCQRSTISIGHRKFQSLSLEFRTSQELRKKGFSVDTGPPRPRDEDKWCGTHTYKPEGQWNTTAENIVEDFKETGHPIFPRYQCVESRY